MVSLLELNQFGILLGEREEDRSATLANGISVVGGILSIEARDMDTKLLSAPESNNTLAKCMYKLLDTGLQGCFQWWPLVLAVPGLMTHLVASLTLDSARSFVMQGASFKQRKASSIPIVFSWGGSISPNGFLPSILLLLVIIVAVVIVVVTVVLVVVVVESSSIIKLSFVIIGSLHRIGKSPNEDSIVSQNLVPIVGNKASYIPIGWANEFHQDKASSVRVPVANFTLQSSEYNGKILESKAFLRGHSNKLLTIRWTHHRDSSSAWWCTVWTIETVALDVVVMKCLLMKFKIMGAWVIQRKDLVSLGEWL
ncbi:hypothetical protein Tco_1357659 [Tanacetum coccineum]